MPFTVILQNKDVAFLEGKIHYDYQSCEKESIFAGTAFVAGNFSIHLRKWCSAASTVKLSNRRSPQQIRICSVISRREYLPLQELHYLLF